MKKAKIILQISCKNQLGEGIFYDSETNALYWVDILGRAIFHYCFNKKRTTEFLQRDRACWIKKTVQNDFLVGYASGIYRMSDDFTEGQLITPIPNPDDHQLRLNDAKVDSDGRLYFGTMDDKESEPLGGLYLWHSDASWSLLDSGYSVSNGPAFSLDNKFLYSVDSANRQIYKFSKDSKGRLSNKSLFFRLEDEMGFPDGLTVDANGYIWVACWQGGRILHLGPDATLIDQIYMPCPFVTNITFVGPNLNYLAVTTARPPTFSQQLESNIDAGDLFILDVGATGVAEHCVKL